MKTWIITFLICLALFFTGLFFADIVATYYFPSQGEHLQPGHPSINSEVALAGSALLLPALPIAFVLDAIRTEFIFPIWPRLRLANLLPYDLILSALLYASCVTAIARCFQAEGNKKPSDDQSDDGHA